LVKAEIKGGIISHKAYPSFTKMSDGTIAYIVNRKEFDTYLVEEAKKAGVKFLSSCEFNSFEKKGDLIRANTSRGMFSVGLCEEKVLQIR